MKHNQKHKLNTKVETYQSKKKRLSKEVYDILNRYGYLTQDEVKSKRKTREYKTTLATNFNTINETIEFIGKFETLKDLSTSYDNFCFIDKHIFFTIRPLLDKEHYKPNNKRVL